MTSDLSNSLPDGPSWRWSRRYKWRAQLVVKLGRQVGRAVHGLNWWHRRSRKHRGECEFDRGRGKPDDAPAMDKIHLWGTR